MSSSMRYEDLIQLRYYQITKLLRPRKQSEACLCEVCNKQSIHSCEAVVAVHQKVYAVARWVCNVTGVCFMCCLK